MQIFNEVLTETVKENPKGTLITIIVLATIHVAIHAIDALRDQS